MRQAWYIIRLIFFPIRLVIYWWHSVLVFLSKPGAKLVIPMFLVGIGLLLRTYIDPIFGELITSMASPLYGTAAFDYRVELAFSVVFIVIYFALMILAKMLSPVVGTFPAPKRPLTPMKPLKVKEHTVETVTATVALKNPVRGYFNGKLVRLVKRLPLDIQAVLERREEEPEIIPPPAPPESVRHGGDSGPDVVRAVQPPPPPKTAQDAPERSVKPPSSAEPPTPVPRQQPPRPQVATGDRNPLSPPPMPSLPE